MRSPRSPTSLHESPGLTLIEILVALAAAALLMVALGASISGALDVWDATQEKKELTREAHFAMNRMVAAVRATNLQMIPLPENPATPHTESIRDVLAVTMDPTLDRDRDGFFDVDNDRDGRLDEDPGGNLNADGDSGINTLDDDGDGTVDDGVGADDDEDGVSNEDPINGIDDDGDGAIDEDPGADVNGDGAPGVAGVDDDGDGSTDEGNGNDDDEDGTSNEDWLDFVSYFVNGTDLVERMPDPHPTNGNDFTDSVLVENVSLFRVERVPSGASARTVILDLTLELTAPSGTTVSVTSRVRAENTL